MSLDWRFINGKKTTDDPDLSKYIEPMVYSCMFVDLSGITEKNIEQWLYRTAYNKMIGKPFGSHCVVRKDGTKKIEDWYPNEALLKKFIGLSTNVSTETRAAWLKKTHRTLDRDALLEVRSLREKGDAAVPE